MTSAHKVPHSFVSTLCLAAVLATPLSSQAAPLPTEPARPAPGPVQGLRWRGVSVDDQRGDGSVWALAERYKAGFEAGRATFIPFFGSAAARSWPFTMRLLPFAQGPMAAGIPRAEGCRVTMRHGPIDEIYELSETVMEQRFLVHERPGAGDLVLRLAVETELRSAGRQPGLGLVFEGPDGRMAYGDAVAIDAEGRRLPFAPALSGGVLELRVPAAFVAAARFPLLIDPVLSVHTIAEAIQTEVKPDVAWSPKQNVWTVVFERIFSASDSDIVAARVTPTGTLLGTEAVAATSTEEVSGHVAIGSGTAAVDRFVFVWIRITGSGRTLETRDRLADRGTFDSVRVIDSGGNIGQVPSAPALGGSVSTTLPHGPCLVVYNFTSTLNDELRGRTINPGGSLGSLRTLIAKPGCGPEVAINRCSLKPQWAVVWTDKQVLNCRPGTVFTTIVTDTGTVFGAQQLSTGNNDHQPAVGGDGSQFFVNWIGDDAVAAQSVFGAYVTTVGGYRRRFVKSLTLDEPNGRRNVPHSQPVVDFDGCRLVCAYGESSLTFAMTFGVTPDLQDVLFQEGRIQVDPRLSHSDRAIAAQGSAGGPPGIYLIAWQESGANAQIRAAFYAGRSSAPHRFLPASCSKTPPGLLLANPPALGLTLRVDMKGATAAPVLMFGGPSILVPMCSTAFGSCGIGLSPIVIRGGTNFQAPIPRDVRLAGVRVFFQGFDVLAPGGCTAPLAFTSTDVLEVTIQ